MLPRSSYVTALPVACTATWSPREGGYCRLGRWAASFVAQQPRAGATTPALIAGAISTSAPAWDPEYRQLKRYLWIPGACTKYPNTYLPATNCIACRHALVTLRGTSFSRPRGRPSCPLVATTIASSWPGGGGRLSRGRLGRTVPVPVRPSRGRERERRVCNGAVRVAGTQGTSIAYVRAVRRYEFRCLREDMGWGRGRQSAIGKMARRLVSSSSPTCSPGLLDRTYMAVTGATTPVPVLRRLASQDSTIQC